MAQAGEAVPRWAGLGRTLGRAGAGLYQKGVASESGLRLRTHARTRMLLLWFRALCRHFQHVPRRVPCRQVSRGAKASRAG